MLASRHRTALLAALLALFATASVGAELVRYDFEGEVFTAISSHAQVTPSVFGYVGDGTTNFFAGHNSTDALRSTKWPLDLTPDDAFQFSIAVEKGYVINLTDLNFFQFRSADGPTNWLVRYSRDGATYYDLGKGDTTLSWRTQTDTADSTPPFDLTGTVTFRIYAVGAVDAGGTWRVDDVVLNGDVRIDDRTRVYRYQGFDDVAQDNWTFTTNKVGGDVTNSTAMQYVGPRAVRLAGSAAGNAGPDIISANVTLSGVSNLQLRVAYAADEPDTDEDLWIDVSYNNWATADSVKLVDGNNGLDLAFGATSAQTVDQNPYVTNLPSVITQVAIKIRFDETSGADNRNDFYFVDDIRLLGEVTPAVVAPEVAVYGAASGINAGQAMVTAHVIDGYPNPELTVYYGPVDGGTDAASWAFSANLGAKGWGLAQATLTGLAPGTVYYYTFHVGNSQGSNWADTTDSFATSTSTLSATGRMFLDSFSVGTNMPLSVDADQNGLSDRWEIENLGGTGADPNSHSDADGVSDGNEFAAGTDPTDAASYMRIVSLDLADETSSDIAITVSGGDNSSASMFLGDQVGAARSFRVRATDNDGGGTKSLIGSVADGGSGSNVYMDSGAADLFSARYYDVAVTFGEQGYTNTEQWAMHVQDRAASEQFLISVPVTYGGTDDNFQGTLGEQLARGLYRALNTGDVVRFWTAAGDWVSCLLTTNGVGDIQWTTNGVTADIDVTPGMAMWVYRSGNSAPRANAVFTGKSFLEGDAVAFNFKTNAGGWTTFGWPLPQTRRHRNSDASQDQLGFFSAGGTGGRVSTTNATLLGDELWIWKNNTWQGSYSLLDKVGAPWDGRWWDNNRRRLADITLEPGGAYYYRHRTNWGGSNFTWTPENP